MMQNFVAVACRGRLIIGVGDNFISKGIRAVMKKIQKKYRDLQGEEMVRIICQVADSQKALDIVAMDVRGLSGFADYFVIMAGTSSRHVQGLAGVIDREISSKRSKSAETEGLNEGQWILLDFNDVIVHIFHHEIRAHYDLEGLWHDAPRLDLTVPPPVVAEPVLKKPKKKPVAKAVEKVAEKAAEKPAKRSPRKIVEQPEKAARKAPERAALPAVRKAARPTARPADKPTGKLIGRVSGRPTGKPTGRPAGKPASKAMAKSTSKPLARPTAKATDKPTGRTSARPTARPTDKPARKPTGKPTGKPTVKAVKKATTPRRGSTGGPKK